jgi:hypothetical protein
MAMRIAAGAVSACAMPPAHAQSAFVFTDVSASSGLASFSHNPNALAVPGLLEWTMGGLGVADFNGDGWPDIFVPRGGVGTDRLFMNQGNGTFANEAAARGVAAVHAGNGVACADFDGDGDIDIHVSSFGTATDNIGQVGRHRLYRNDGGVFTDVAVASGVATTSPAVSTAAGAAWGDLDLDGDLDLAVCGYSATANGNRVFRNDGGAFTDITGAGFAVQGTWGFQPLWVDSTGDGFPELFIAADFQTSRALRNRRDGTLVLATADFGMGIDRNGMGICVGDFDRNGAVDTYVTSIFNDTPPAAGFNGNTLYLNQGDGACVQDAEARGCVDGGWGWGAVAADLDLDGWEDIVEVNGRSGGEWMGEQEYVYRNLGGTFARLGAETGLSLAADARCVATLDFDRDGDLDLLMLVHSGPLKLFRNDTPRVGRWLQLELGGGAGSRCAPHGIGAVVECEALDGDAVEVMRRWVHSGSGYQSSSEPVVHLGFGVGNSPPDGSKRGGSARVRVLWPSGQTTVRDGVALDSRVAIAAPARADVDGDGTVGAGDLSAIMAAWGGMDRAQRSVRAADIDGDGVIDARDVLEVLSGWTH